MATENNTFDLKYRPKDIKDIVGQGVVKASLSAMFKDGNISRSYFVYGPFGTGKTTTSRIIAKYAVCTSPTEEGLPCGKCKSCSYTVENPVQHPDVEEINGSEKGKKDDIRDLISRMSFAPKLGRYKVIIIDECHKLTHDSFQALLKPFENPPKRTIVILATSEENKVPAALKSRGKQLKMDLISSKDMAVFLNKVSKKELPKGVSLNKKHLIKIAESSGGHLRNALKTLEDIVIILKTKNIDAKDISKYVTSTVKSCLQYSLNATIYTALLALYTNNFSRTLYALKQVDVSKSYFLEQAIKHHIQAIYYFEDMIQREEIEDPSKRYRLKDTRYNNWYGQLQKTIDNPLDSDIMAYILDSFTDTLTKMKTYMIDENLLLINAFIRNFNTVNSFYAFEDDEEE